MRFSPPAFASLSLTLPLQCDVQPTCHLPVTGHPRHVPPSHSPARRPRPAPSSVLTPSPTMSNKSGNHSNPNSNSNTNTNPNPNTNTNSNFSNAAGSGTGNTNSNRPPPPPQNANTNVSNADSGTPPPSIGDESFIQCPRCSAMYEIDADELDTTPRVVACSACLHEWTASETSLMWGDIVALNALLSSKKKQHPSYVRTLQSSNSNSTSDSDRARRRRPISSPSSSPLGIAGKNQNTSGRPSPGIARTRDQQPQQRASSISSSSSANSNNSAGGKEQDEIDMPNIGSEHLVNDDEDEDDSFTAALVENDEDDGVGDPKELGMKEQTRQGQKDTSSVTPTVSGTAAQVQFEHEGRPVIFVGNLSFRATDDDLYRAFSGYGSVENCVIATTPTGHSKGFGFVQMGSFDDCNVALSALNGVNLLGRDVILSYARRDTVVMYPPFSGTDGRPQQQQQQNQQQYRERRSYRGAGGGDGGASAKSAARNGVPWFKRGASANNGAPGGTAGGGRSVYNNGPGANGGSRNGSNDAKEKYNRNRDFRR